MFSLSQVEKVRKTGSTLMSLCGEPDKPEVKKHMEDLDNAWDNITALYARREENLIDAMEKAMEFHDTLQVRAMIKKCCKGLKILILFNTYFETCFIWYQKNIIFFENLFYNLVSRLVRDKKHILSQYFLLLLGFEKYINKVPTMKLVLDIGERNKT